MRKKVFGRKFGRERDSRRALFRSLIRSFALYGKISTTKAKAKAVQPDIEKLIVMAKGNSIASLRRLNAFLGNDGKTTELITKAAKVFEKRKSGFTRMINLARRPGDFAEMVRLEWSEKVESDKSTKGIKSTKSTKGKKETDNAKEVAEKPAKKKTLRERLTDLKKKR